MSFAPNNLSDVQNEEYFRNPRLAMLRALQNRGINTNQNYLAGRMLDRSSELVPLAYAYGGDQESFLDFANQYAGGQLGASGGGQRFSNADIRQRVAALQNNNDPNSDAYNWMREGSPEEQFQNFQAMQALSQRGRLPGFAQANMATKQRQYENWMNQYLQGGAGYSGPTNWMDAFLGRNTQSPAAAAPAVTPAAGATYATPAAPTPAGVKPSVPGTAQGGDMQAFGGSTMTKTMGNLPVNGWTPIDNHGYGAASNAPIKYQQFQSIISQIQQAQQTGVPVRIGNITYDPAKDDERWWHGNPENRFARGESSGQRLIRRLTEAAQGKRDHVAGQVNPNDPTATFGNLVNMLMQEIRDRSKTGTHDPNQYGFWYNQ